MFWLLVKQYDYFWSIRENKDFNKKLREESNKGNIHSVEQHVRIIRKYINYQIYNDALLILLLCTDYFTSDKIETLWSGVSWCKSQQIKD